MITIGHRLRLARPGHPVPPARFGLDDHDRMGRRAIGIRQGASYR
ncbi:hypothetical protein [Microlunatus soli]|nr:hypothetical protein [Microlunatus soli]